MVIVLSGYLSQNLNSFANDSPLYADSVLTDRLIPSSPMLFYKKAVKKMNPFGFIQNLPAKATLLPSRP